MCDDPSGVEEAEPAAQAVDCVLIKLTLAPWKESGQALGRATLLLLRSPLSSLQASFFFPLPISSLTPLEHPVLARMPVGAEAGEASDMLRSPRYLPADGPHRIADGRMTPWGPTPSDTLFGPLLSRLRSNCSAECTWKGGPAGVEYSDTSVSLDKGHLDSGPLDRLLLFSLSPPAAQRAKQKRTLHT